MGFGMVELLNKKMSYAANPLFEWRDSFIQLKKTTKKLSTLHQEHC